MPNKTHAEIPLAYLDYRATYREPMFGFVKLYGDVSQGVFAALQEWGISLEKVTHKQNPVNFGEVGITFELLGKVTIHVGLGSMGVWVTNPNWSEEAVIAKIIQAAVGAVRASGALDVATQRTTIGMHVKPDSGTIKEFVSNIATFHAGSLSNNAQCFGVAIFGEHVTWLADKSVLFPNALFVKIEYSSGSELNFEETARLLKNEEGRLLELLRLEVD